MEQRGGETQAVWIQWNKRPAFPIKYHKANKSVSWEIILFQFESLSQIPCFITYLSIVWMFPKMCDFPLWGVGICGFLNFCEWIRRCGEHQQPRLRIWVKYLPDTGFAFLHCAFSNVLFSTVRFQMCSQIAYLGKISPLQWHPEVSKMSPRCQLILCPPFFTFTFTILYCSTLFYVQIPCSLILAIHKVRNWTLSQFPQSGHFTTCQKYPLTLKLGGFTKPGKHEFSNLFHKFSSEK